MNNNYNCAAHKSKNLRDIFAVIIAIAAPLSRCQPEDMDICSLSTPGVLLHF